MNSYNRKKDNAVRGMILTLVGGTLWGFSGTCGQFLMQTKGVTSNWLVPIRLLLAGALLLFICWLKDGRGIFRIWIQDAASILIFGILGMSMCQYTYFTAIGASNAGTATVLQYIGPVLILIYLSLRNRKPPRPVELLAIILAVAGTFLLATHGRPGSMVLSKTALFWGLLSAVALAVYTVQPGRLLNEYGSAVVTAWGMLIGGIFLCVFIKPWHVIGMWDIYTVLAMAAVILVGTILSFTTYMEGVRLIGASKASLFASVEPVTATFMTVVFMGAAFQFVDFIGLAGILGAVLMLSLLKKE